MKSLKRITAVTLSAALVAGLVTGPVNVSYAAGNIEKEETVYVNQTAGGDVKSITVSDWLKNVSGTGEIKDRSNLKDIKNVKGNEKFTEENGNLTWQANDTDIYYQGTTTEKLPVGVKISYKLDGKDITAEELAGKSGNVEIIINYVNDTSYEDEIDGEKAQLKSPFLMASAVILPVDVFSDVEVSQGKVVSEGSNQILLAYGMPGLFDSLKLAKDTREKIEDSLSDTVTIKAKVKDFELASIYTVATSDELTNVDLGKNNDMDDLEDALDELEDASEKLVSGSSDLSDGVKTLEDNFKDYASGVSKVSSGASSLSDGAGKLSTGIKKYTDGVGTLTTGAGDYVKGTGALTKGVKAYVEGEKKVAEGAKQLSEGSSSFPEKYKEFDTGLKQYTAGADSVAENLKALAAGANDLSKGVETAVTGVKTSSQQTKGALTQLGTNAQNYGPAITQLVTELTALKDNNTITPEQYNSLMTSVNIIKSSAENEGTILTALNSQSSDLSSLDALTEGAKELSGKAALLSAGAQKLSSGSAALNEGSDAIGNGIANVVGGITGLYNGIKTLSENNDALVSGAETLEKSGSLLTSGIGQLTTSTKTLNESAKKFADGAKTLSDGASKIDVATGKVNDGIGKLSEGSVKLSDGMGEFKTKGTDKLKNEYNDKVKTVLDRLDSLTGKAGEYNSFSGLADGMDGKVKFIFQTAEIKTED